MKIKEAIENPYNETNNLYELSVDGSLLEMLLEIERILDESHLYAYENWKEGCVVKGPEVKRHWVNIVLQYPKDKMPDPEGAKRLLKLKIRPKYERATIENYRKITSEDDIDKETGKAILDKEDVWYVHLEVPREFVQDVKPSELADVVQQQPAPPQQEQMAPAPAEAPAEAPAPELGA
tara:strand:+ start:735 stop:1271 length:537 start_codon:yes stop_codon:yes gene_type:complete